MKTIRKQHIVERGEITHTLAERLVLARVNNPFIVPLKFSFQSAQKLYLVLAYVFSPISQLSDADQRLDSSTVESCSITCSVSSDSTRSEVGSTALSFCSHWNISMSWTSSTGK